MAIGDIYKKSIYDPATGEMISPYDEQYKTRLSSDMSFYSGVKDKSGAIEPGVVESGQVDSLAPAADSASASKGGMAAAADVSKTMQAGGSPIEMAGSGMTAAGMATANPYLVAAGLGTSAASSIMKGKNQREQNQYLAEVQKYNQRQNAINRMAQISQNLKA